MPKKKNLPVKLDAEVFTALKSALRFPRGIDNYQPKKKELFAIFSSNWEKHVDSLADVANDLKQLGININTVSTAFSSFSAGTWGDDNCIAAAQWLLCKDRSLASEVVEVFQPSCDITEDKLKDIFGWDQQSVLDDNTEPDSENSNRKNPTYSWQLAVAAGSPFGQ